MTAVASHRIALKWAADLLEMVMADVTDEQLHWPPPGIANPIGALYAHGVCALDTVIHSLLLGRSPLFASDLAGTTGISDPNWALTYDWGRSVQLNLPETRAYARQVYAAADAYIAGLDEPALQREIDLSNMGAGMQSVDWMLSALCTGHLNNMAGEISCLKGIQGAKGYPF